MTQDQGKHKAKADPLYDKTKPAKKQGLFRPSDFIHDPHTNTCTARLAKCSTAMAATAP